MRILGIDYGDRRVGLAIGDTEVPIATGLPTLWRQAARLSHMVQASRLHPRHADLTDTLRRICREHGVDRIVVGVPANMDGSLGERARLSLELAQSLRDELGIEVETWDERLTTRQAERAMLEGDLTRKKRKERIDRLAAQLMLQSYLDAQRSRP